MSRKNLMHQAKHQYRTAKQEAKFNGDQLEQVSVLSEQLIADRHHMEYLKNRNNWLEAKTEALVKDKVRLVDLVQKSRIGGLLQGFGIGALVACVVIWVFSR